MADRPNPDIPLSPRVDNDRDVAAMFANQAAWLVRNVAGTVLFANPAGKLQPSDLVAVGSHGVAITNSAGPEVDEALRWLRTTPSSNVLIWSAVALDEAGILLAARGCRDSFRPLWMRSALADRLPFPRIEADVEIVIASPGDRGALLAASDIPYFSTNQALTLLHLATAPDKPRRVWMVLARGQRRVAGAGILHLSEHNGEMIGGLYNLGVDPALRGQGIGTALTLELCRVARDHGANCIMLNATPDGERIYRQLDFTPIGEGQTWFLPSASLRNPPSAADIARAEAIAHGDTIVLEDQVARVRSLPNGESPLRFAARFEQRDSALWLLDRGADPEIVPLWMLGFRDEAIHAAGDVRWLNAPRGPESTTSLHDAIRLNDADLVRMLVAAGADLTIRDGQWRGTPLDWANALCHPDLAEIIKLATPA